MTRSLYLETLLVTLVLSMSPSAYAQDVAAIRGGWIADVEGVRHVLYLVARNGTLTGVYCTQCDVPANLAFVQEGRLANSELRFAVQYVPDAAAPFRENVVGTPVGAAPSAPPRHPNRAESCAARCVFGLWCRPS